MNYYNEIEHIIKRNEINKKARILEDNYDTLNNYREIGKLIVEAQGGENRAKYGNELIKEWSKDFTKLYGKGYSERNLRYFRQFYNLFPIWQPVVAKLTWSHYLQLFPLKDKNKINYYINLCIEHNLSKRELIEEIKSDSYGRLLDKPDKIEIQELKQNIKISSNIKNPIIIYLDKNEKILNEHDLQIKLLTNLQVLFRQLGNGYTLVGNEYKITHKSHDYFIDMLLFNYKLNRFIVIELKTRKLKREDKAQTKFYMELVDTYIKETNHNKTLGIIISKSHDEFIATFVSDEDIIPLTYELKEK